MKYFILVLTTLLLAGCAGNQKKLSAEQTFAESQPEVSSTNNHEPSITEATSESPVILIGNAEGFPFEYRGQIIYVGMPAEPIIEQLGEPRRIFIEKSCAFEGEGNDKTYIYSEIELQTFQLGDKDYVLAVILNDDSVKTPEGLYIGMAADDALAILGEDYKEDGGIYTFTKGRGSFMVGTKMGEVKNLYYYYIVGM